MTLLVSAVAAAVTVADMRRVRSPGPLIAVAVTPATTSATTVKESVRLDTLSRVGRLAQRRVSDSSAGGVRDPVPVRLRTELDRLGVAIRLHVAERVVDLVEDHVQLTLLDALVEPGGAEHEPAQPVHERAVRGPDDVRPAVVDVLAEAGRGVLHLAVHGEVHQVLELGAVQAAGDEAELDGGLLHP